MSKSISALCKDYYRYVFPKKPPKPSASALVAASVEATVLTATFRFTEDINDLETKIRKMDEFAASHPELMEKIRNAMKHYDPVHAKSKRPPTDHLDPSNLIDKMTLLEFKKIELEAALDERKLFIERNPEVFECFKKYLLERERAGTPKELAGLITDRI